MWHFHAGVCEQLPVTSSVVEPCPIRLLVRRWNGLNIASVWVKQCKPTLKCKDEPVSFFSHCERATTLMQVIRRQLPVTLQLVELCTLDVDPVQALSTIVPLNVLTNQAMRIRYELCWFAVQGVCCWERCQIGHFSADVAALGLLEPLPSHRRTHSYAKGCSCWRHYGFLHCRLDFCCSFVSIRQTCSVSAMKILISWYLLGTMMFFPAQIAIYPKHGNCKCNEEENTEYCR